MSQVKCHMSCQMSIFFLQSGGASRGLLSTGPTPSSLLCFWRVYNLGLLHFTAKTGALGWIPFSDLSNVTVFLLKLDFIPGLFVFNIIKRIVERMKQMNSVFFS